MRNYPNYQIDMVRGDSLSPLVLNLRDLAKTLTVQISL